MILLDTQALLWMRLGDGRLGRRARQTAERALPAGDLAVSAISLWEIAMLAGTGRIRSPDDVRAWHRELLASGVVEIPVDGEIGIRAASLNGLLRDPADRIIVATALVGGHRLVTADQRILRWTGPLDSLPAAD